MTKYDCTEDVERHIEQVRLNISRVTDELEQRAKLHDASKLLPPEKAIFDKYTMKLREVVFGSQEYKDQLAGMKVGLDHHYEVNRHHPEHFENGVRDMTLIDLIEMLCDWRAAAALQGKPVNYVYLFERFGIRGDLAQIIMNTLHQG